MCALRGMVTFRKRIPTVCSVLSRTSSRSLLFKSTVRDELSSASSAPTDTRMFRVVDPEGSVVVVVLVVGVVTVVLVVVGVAMVVVVVVGAGVPGVNSTCRR